MNNITWAAVQMLAGLKVCRSGWATPGMHLSINRRGIQHIYREDGVRWSPLADDLLVVDWVLFDE